MMMILDSPPLSDRELLAAFVRKADGAAFAVLTEKYLSFVFGVAFRRTGSREMGQEAAQNAFCRLARQAPALLPGMRENVSLGPWLHTVTLREAGTLLRAEAARQRALRRMAETAVPAAPVLDPGPSSPPGSGYLDEALAALPEAARRVLILRYLQGLSLREVAHEENTSEEAARKRVTRAVERLTRILARRGVTAAGVTACLAAAPVLWPAPSSAAALAARAVKQAAAPAAGAGLSGLAGFALSQWPAAAVFLVAAVTAAGPWRALARGSFSNGPSVSGTAAAFSAEGNTGMPNQTPPDGPPVIAGLRTGLRHLLENGRPYRDMRRRVGNRISRLGFSEWRADPVKLAAMRSAVLDFSLDEVKAAAALPDGETAGLIDSVLYSRWAELEPEAALSAAFAHAERTKTLEALRGVLSVQALKDPAKAVLWAWNHAPEELSEGYGPGERRKELVCSLLEPLLGSDPQAWMRLMTSPPLESSNILSRRRAFAGALPYAPDAALQGLLGEEKRGALHGGFAFRDYMDIETLQPAEAESMAAFAGDLPADSVLRRECLNAASQVFARTDPARAADLAVAFRPADPQNEEEWLTSTTALLRDWKAADPAAAAGWLHAATGLDPDVLADLARSAGLPAPALTVPNPPAAAP